MVLSSGTIVASAISALSITALTLALSITAFAIVAFAVALGGGVVAILTHYDAKARIVCVPIVHAEIVPNKDCHDIIVKDIDSYFQQPLIEAQQKPPEQGMVAMHLYTV